MKIHNRKNLVSKRRYLRNNMTHAEVLLWSFLKGKSLGGVKFRRQHSIANYILDFYCSRLKLAIEIDGATHDLTNSIKHDKKRDSFLSSLGIEVIRFRNEQIYGELDNVLNFINCKIEQINNN